ncbi:MAG: formylglycine-generating enzyme family protein [Prevotellaceae bacterium]|nr:formylglycine-generating enzyme family protein [Prevotellaceae bacterium]
MKRFLLSAVILFVLGAVASAQTIEVTDFTFNEHDLTALQPGTMVLDQNGDKCALIKIITTVKGFTFDVGSLGVMKTDDKHTGEIWVYVPYGINKITLSHPEYGQLRNFPIPMSIEKGRTYIMKLKTKRLENSNTLTLKYSPVNAVVLIDGKMIMGTNGVIEKELSIGKHEYSIVANGYNQLDGLAKIEKEAPTVISVQLVPSANSAVAPASDNPSASAPSSPTSPATISDDANGNKVFTVKGVSFTMLPVAGGTFQMGATPEQEKPYSDEKPVHSVTLSSYYIGETEVTQELWEAVMGSNPSNFKGGNNPVEQVSWNDSQEFISRLNAATGQRFRLPTEAEWEYAARGGSKSRGYQYSGSNNLFDVAWYTYNSGSKTHPVKTKQPNELGIYDMSGNVYEWCQDWFADNYYKKHKKNPSSNPTGPTSGSNRVVRGGSWSNVARDCRVADRDDCSPGDRGSYLGLRLALSEL